MSLSRGLQALRLEMPDRIPHTQYISNDPFIRHITGLDTRDHSTHGQIGSALAKALDYDLIWNISERPITGRQTAMGHAVWSEVNPQDNKVYCPFETAEDVLAFDPIAEYGINDHKETVAYFNAILEQACASYPDALFPGGRYHSVFSACIRTFGWDMFLSSVPGNEEAFDRVLEGFAQLSLVESKAWAETDIEAYICHDDITWTSGPVFNPAWYRKYIFPRYEMIWEPLKKAGKKILYCSDGTFSPFIDDIVACGSNGFIFEPTTDLEYMVKKYGKTQVIVGNVDCRALQFGDKAAVRAEVDRCIQLGRDCPGYFMAVGNHIPNGIPLEQVVYYFNYFNEVRDRK